MASPKAALSRQDASELADALFEGHRGTGRSHYELARVYLAHKQRAEADLARLQTSRLFAGTEGPPEIEIEALPAGGR